MEKSKIRVRFAPSPTGELHLGNARTAIFNWLLARRLGGTFILRIEDTDQERSRPEFSRMILEDLRWLGLDWDEGPEAGGEFGPYLQSERIGIYREYAKKLEEKGQTYLCYCSSAELEARRQMSQEKGLAPRYDNRCRFLTREEKLKYESEGRIGVIRFKVEPQIVKIQDLVRGEVTFDTALFGDFVIFKSDGFPTFHFAVAVDDGLMKISHVIRGEDHLSNTPRHVLLFNAMGFDVPQFAHLSMILGPDGTRLSKRHGATSVGFYCDEGYLAQTLLNYMALLGWSNGDDQEIFSRKELVEKFSIERVVGSPAIFNPEKLHWIGKEHLKRISAEEIFLNLEEHFPESISGEIDRAQVYKMIDFVKDRAGTLKELVKELKVFLEEADLTQEEVQKAFALPRSKDVLMKVLEALEKDWTGPDFPVKSLSICQKELGVKGNEFYPIFRLALTGHPHGPELKDLCPVMGKIEVMRRLKKAVQKIEQM